MRTLSAIGLDIIAKILARRLYFGHKVGDRYINILNSHGKYEIEYRSLEQIIQSKVAFSFGEAINIAQEFEELAINREKMGLIRNQEKEVKKTLKKPGITQEEFENILNLRNSGMTFQSIAIQTGRSFGSVYRVVKLGDWQKFIDTKSLKTKKTNGETETEEVKKEFKLTGREFLLSYLTKCAREANFSDAQNVLRLLKLIELAKKVENINSREDIISLLASEV